MDEQGIFLFTELYPLLDGGVADRLQAHPRQALFLPEVFERLPDMRARVQAQAVLFFFQRTQPDGERVNLRLRAAHVVSLRTRRRRLRGTGDGRAPRQAQANRKNQPRLLH